MIESVHGPTTNLTDRLLMSAVFLAALVACAYSAILAAGGEVLPSPVNTMIFTGLALVITGLMIRRARDQIIRHIDQAAARHAEQRVYSSEAVTRDLSRVQRVIASVPAVVGLDQGVMDIGARIARRLSEVD